MAPSAEIVAEFLAAAKIITPARRLNWTRRNAGHFVARVGVEAGGATVGELVLVVGVVVSRNWSFKLLRRGEEVLRWDLTSPPARHSNPPGRPAGFPGTVRELEHEHRWVDGLGMRCAVPLTVSGDHRQTLEAFCDRAKIDFQAPYDAPPPPGEQLQFHQ